MELKQEVCAVVHDGSRDTVEANCAFGRRDCDLAVVGGGRLKANVLFTNGELLGCRVIAGALPNCAEYTVKYLGPVGEQFIYSVAFNEVVLEIPLEMLAPRLSVREIDEVIRFHHISVSYRSRNLTDKVKLVVAHQCEERCVRQYGMFEVVRAVGYKLNAVTTAHWSTENGNEGKPGFPPVPLTDRERANVVSSWCEAFALSEVGETACAVCGRLILLKYIRTIPLHHVDLHVLDRTGKGVTCVERRSDADPFAELTRPILYEKAIKTLGGTKTIDVCQTCLNVVRRRQIPKESLANGLWIGDVPGELQAANFMERMLIAKVRHNFFVAKVTKGQRKLCANAIMFTQPVARVMNVLPPPRTELDECLAILFVGSCKPTEKDFQRTPFMIRHEVVYRALTWLRHNHPDYANVVISMDNLCSYREGEVPVCVIYRTGDGTAPAESLAVNEDDEERGTEQGPCSFSVQALTGREFVNMSYKEKIATALKHFETGGKVLAYGHESQPESIYHNPGLFPGMFPWLFPYGRGAFENSHICTKIDRITHVRHLLMYADRRFQVDECFPFIVFNHEQIRASTHGGYLLTSRVNFPSVVDKILNLNTVALDSLIDRGKTGEYVRSQNEEERKCFELMSIVDHVAGHVQGSATSRKYQRNEIKSLIIALGVPVFFITFSPVDIKHPLCLYYCGEEIDLLSEEPELPDIGSALRAIAANPVACARFFHVMVTAFIEKILKAGSNEDGLFGRTESYYGTVESQGRLTLHLHLLLWIASCLTPQEIRTRIMNDDEFRLQLIAWLESCVHGEYSTGSADEVANFVGESVKGCKGRDATMQMPKKPEQNMDEITLAKWIETYKYTADEIVFRSNRHDSGHKKGCLRGSPKYCRARFPRELFPETMVDMSSGAIRLRKQDAWINTYNPLLSYVLRCNSDVSCLLSGTQVKAVVAYVTDYVTKSNLNTHTFFETVHAVLDRNQDLLHEATDVRKDCARKLISKIVNALTALQETGGPAVCAYLLGHPDHYTDRRFKTCFWKCYVQCAAGGAYEADKRFLHEPQGQEKVVLGLDKDRSVVALTRVTDYQMRPTEMEQWSLYDFLTCTDNTPLKRRKRKAVESDFSGSSDTSATDDDDTDNDTCGNPGTQFQFLEGHPKRDTHRVITLAESKRYVLNFLGGPLPRRDCGDREEYCLTMLVLFHPRGWRKGSDLKSESQTWEYVFDSVEFKAEHVQVMKNMNVLYECLDARDDYAAQRKKDSQQSHIYFGDGNLPADMDDNVDAFEDEALRVPNNDLIALLDDPSGGMGKHTGKIYTEMNSVKALFQSFTARGRATRKHDLSTMEVANPQLERPIRPASGWKTIVDDAKRVEIERKKGRTESEADVTLAGPFVAAYKMRHQPVVRILTEEEVYALSRHGLDTSRGPQDHHLLILHSVLETFTLNEEQFHAFYIVAAHLHHHEPVPLRMYLGGMGGTGKSRVLIAVMFFLIIRGEEHRFIVLGPTGSTAALIDGSTYHSILGFGQSFNHSDSVTLTSLAKVRDRLERVDLIFLDEVSMVSCIDLYHISTQITKAFGDPAQSFGGKDVVLAGDFAQLPPPGRGQHSLYSDSVSAEASSDDVRKQQNAVGKALWHSFNTVIILRQNMRQAGLSDEDKKFRTCLENARMKSCTQPDLALLESRIVTPTQHPEELAHPQFQFVSVITARNSARDAINEHCAPVFAAHQDQRLHHFYSVDSWTKPHESTSVRQSQKDVQSNIDPVRKTNRVSDGDRGILWNIPPSLSEHHAGVLTLCRNMPVLIKYNVATELCTTNGAEATVWDWDAHMSEDGKEILDVLFVKLSNPPRSVQIEGLPLNVIPLTKLSKRIRCTMTSDRTVSIVREQIPVLLNFAMTDFGAQGRTRPNNVCYLKHCRSSLSIYTCLSRSSSLQGTLLIEGFDKSKLTGGLSESLRTEFRELEILDDISKMKHNLTLPASITGCTRAELIRGYQQHYGLNHLPHTAHSSLATAGCFVPLRTVGDKIAWRLIETQPTKRKLPPPKKKKRLCKGEAWAPSTAQSSQQLRSTSSLAKAADARTMDGLIWDSSNWSCAYDAVLTVVWNTFLDGGGQWLDALCPGNALLACVRHSFFNVLEGIVSLEQVRNDLRDTLFTLRPNLFPRWGPKLTSITEVMQCLFCTPVSFASSSIVCDRCAQSFATNVDIGHSYVWSIFPFLWEGTNVPTSVSTSASIERLLLSGYMKRCPSCRTNCRTVTTLHSVPPLIILDVSQLAPTTCVYRPEAKIILNVADHPHSLRLCGAIYAGFAHFTARIITRIQDVWYHDGASLGTKCLKEGALRTLHSKLDYAYQRQVTHYLYALD